MFTRQAVLAAALLTASAGAIAGPRAIEVTPTITTPDPTYLWPLNIAVDGDWLIATGRKDSSELDPSLTDSSAWLYQRQSNGSWTLVRRLVQHLVNEDGDEPIMDVDMDGGVAAIIKEAESWIFERSGASWVQVPSPIQTDGMDVDVQGGTIVVTDTDCSFVSNAYRKGSNGAWTLVRSTPPESLEECENEDEFGDVDVSGSSIIVATVTDSRIHSARIFEGPFGGAATQTTLVGTQTERLRGHTVAIDGSSALAAAALPQHGVLAYTRDASGSWNRTGALLRPDGLFAAGGTIEARNGLAVQTASQDQTYGQRSGSVSVFQRNTDGTYRYAARLLASDRGPERFFGSRVDISGRRVITGDTEVDSIYVVDLPTDLTENATVQDNFEDGSANGWTQTTGSSFTVATTSSSRVFRQLSDVSNSAATLNGTDWRNQAVEADIKPTAYAAGNGDRWFGLVTRYANASNYYYVTVRNTNIAQIKKIVNGAVTTLGTFGLPVTLNRSYRVRLEAIGTRLRLYVDNVLQVEATDSSLSRGLAGVMTYRTKADYDNVVVSANPQTPLAIYRFEDDVVPWFAWERVGTWADASDGGTIVLTQTDTTSGAQLMVGIPTDDQVVSARMRRMGAAGSNNWFGLAARFRDASNYYYITIRNNNVLSLRKLADGAIVELDAAPFTATTNTWYRVRFEAVKDHLRVYINDVLLLEATDTSHPTGTYGPVMYRTSAQYDDLIAVQP